MKTVHRLLALRSSLFIGFLFLSCSLFAQNYQPGFVIDQAGDSLRGYVLFEDHFFNRRNCAFKTSENAPKQSYVATDIRAYGVDGIAMFRSVELDKKSGDKKMVFLEYMLQGSPSLLRLGNQYFIEDGDRLEALRMKKDTVRQGDKVFVKEGQAFRSLLMQQFGSCSEMLDMLEEAKSGGTSLYDLFQTFHECKDLPYQSFYAQKQWFQFQLGAGITANHFYLYPKRFAGSTYYFEQTDLPWYQFLSPSVSLRISYPRMNSRLAVRIGLAYSQFTYSISDVNDRAGIDLLYEMDIASSILEIPITFSYNLTKATNKVIVPYVFAGVSTGIPLSITGERRTIGSSGTNLSSNSLSSRSGIYTIRGGLGSTFNLNSSVSLFAELWGEGTNGFIVPDDNNVLLFRRSMCLTLGMYLVGQKKD